MIVVAGCTSEQGGKGHELYGHYCSHCHGESGKQNEGFNWSSMPDPKPKDLTNKSEMATLKDVDIFNTISRDMKDTSEGGDVIGDFQTGTDKAQLTGLGFASFDQVQANMTTDGVSTALDLGLGDFVVFNGVTSASFVAGDFVL